MKNKQYKSKKLTEAQIQQVQGLYANGGQSVRNLALQFAVGKTTIGNLVKDVEKPISTPEQRFWAYVDICGEDDCWEWTAGRNDDGYGKFDASCFGTERASRIAYMLSFSEIPDGLLVRHRCDNPSCCNPKHLQLGDSGDNGRDMAERGRAYGGGSRSKLGEVEELELHFLRGLKRDDSDRPRYTIHELTAFAGMTVGSAIRKTLAKDPIELQCQFLERKTLP